MRRPFRHAVHVLAGVVAAGGLAAVAPASSAAPPAAPDRDRLEVYVGQLLPGQLADVVALGVDRHELDLSRATGSAGGSAADGKSLVRVEVVLSGSEVAQLAKQGIELSAKKVGGRTVTQRADAAATEGHEVWQQYAGPGGLKEEVEQLAARYPWITKTVSIGQTVNGQDIMAVKVTKAADKTRDGKRPAVLYLSAQHAREWITPEMTTRLLRRVVEGYSSSRSLKRLLSRTELWFMPVANPDGYDYTFTEGQRLWRKNLRDNDGDGEITGNDGVDLNRNWQVKWGYDNEGSSPQPTSQTYRGTGPASEPETQALDRFARRVGFEFLVNYHSAAELLLYGTGWQVATPTPDDLIYEALAGDDQEPAVPGYDPDLSAELYTTNGDTDTAITARYGTLGFTPEMSTCEAASDVDPDDEWEAEDCGSGFEFPDDEGLVQAEFAKNVPFAMSIARSAADPADPKSSLGLRAPNFQVDAFSVSYGSPQPAAALIERALKKKRMKYRINRGKIRTVKVREWRGGERYGDENDDYFAEYRGQVKGADRGDRVRVWFTGKELRKGKKKAERPGKKPKKKFRTVGSRRFTFRIASDTGHDVLVVANEDYTGVNPDYPADVTAPKYAGAHVDAIEAAGRSADVWDVDAQGVPHHLGVLSHYDAVVWYLGDNRITMDPEDLETDSPFGPLPDVSVAERQQYLTIAVRDYLNEGGKLLHAGETAQYQGLTGISDAVGGLYYGLNGDASADCVVDSVPGFFEDCLIMADDFRQYYLGAFTRLDATDPATVEGIAAPLTGYEGTLGGPVVEGDNPLDEAGILQPTSDVLPVEDFPQFASEGSALFPVEEGSQFDPVEGDRYAGVLHQDDSYARLTRTVDLTTATSAELQFKTSFNTEPSYDNLVVEARTAGGEDWATLPEVGGLSDTTPPAECEAGGFLLSLHPFLERYLGGPDCTEGEWHALTGDATWADVAYDLSAFAGSTVEVSITYVTDPGSGGVGAFVDDTHVSVDGADRPDLADGFEGATSQWAPGEVPEGSPTPSPATWVFSDGLIEQFAATSTEDSLLLGFGLEQLATAGERADLVERALDGLLD